MPAVEMLSEPVFILDIYASGLSHIEDVGDGDMQFTFYKRQRSIHGGEEWNVVARIVMSYSAVHAAMKMTMVKTGHACCGAGRMKDRH